VPDAIIKIENVSWAYNHTRNWALKNINITIDEGEFVAVMGENGAGKTSFCRILNGLIPHSLPGKLLGTVAVDGIVTASSSVVQLSQKVGMAFDDPETQFLTAKVDDEVAFALENLCMPKDQIREKVRWALDKAGLSAYADYAPSALSGGQKQRLAIAAALAMATRVLVLDDPSSQLDPSGAKEVLSFIRELRGRKLTVVMATGSCEEATEFADKVCVLKNGCIATFGKPRDIFADRLLLEDCGIEMNRFLPGRMKGIMPTVNPSTLIRLEHLHYWYEPGKTILNDINISFMENEFTVIIGQNGSGKTTLLKNISGLLRPSSGTVFLRGQDTVNLGIADIASEIGFIMQDPDRQLFESTVYNEVAYALKGSLPKQEIQKKAEEALATVDLIEKRDAFPPSLDRADRIKTVFASVLAIGSKIIMLDEPLAGQDKRGCRLIMDILENLYQHGYTIIMVTHNINMASMYANRIIVMKGGEIFMDGKPEEDL
jgi:energy-coupling factor transport system ATP-binding protein